MLLPSLYNVRAGLGSVYWNNLGGGHMGWKIVWDGGAHNLPII